MMLGILNFQSGNLEGARTQLERCFILSEQAGEKRASFWSSVRLGYVALRIGELKRAWQIFTQSQQLLMEIHDQSGVVFLLEGLASLSVRQNQPEQAAWLFAWADATRTEIQDTRPAHRRRRSDRSST